MPYDIIFINSTPIPAKKVRGLGPHLLSAEARKHGYSSIVLDFIESWTLEDFKKAVDKFVGDNTKFVGISVTWAATGVGKVGSGIMGFGHFEERQGNPPRLGDYIINGNSKFLKETILRKNPNIKFLIGGSKARTLDQNLGDYVDHIFEGYCETQFIDFLNNSEKYDRIIDHDTKAWSKHTGYDFAKTEQTFTGNSFLTPADVIPIECSRGCRFKCKFCSFPLIGMKNAASYTKDAENFRRELIHNYENYGIQKYSIQDDTFNDSTEKVRMFAEVVDSLPFKIYFWCYLRADLLVTHPEQIELLHQMGLAETWFGIETYNHKSGQAVGKGMDPNRLKEMLYSAKEVWKDDVLVQQGLIVGLPYENKQSIKESVDWLKRDDCPVDTALMVPLVIRPKLFQERFHSNYLSEFDKTYEQYGYEFPNATNEKLKEATGVYNAMRWIKNDDTDINSYDEVLELIKKYQPLIDSKKYMYGKKVGIFETALDFSHNFSNDMIRNFTYDEQQNFKEILTNDIDYFDRSIKQYYIEPLLNSDY